MKLIFYAAFYIMLMVVILHSCTEEADNDNTRCFNNLKAIVVAKGNGLNKNGSSVLIRSLKDTTLYTELTASNFGNSQYGNQLYWTKNVGDTLHFDYILKSRFWKSTKPLSIKVDTALISLQSQIKARDTMLTAYHLRVDKLINISESLVKESYRLAHERDSVINFLKKCKNDNK